MGFSPYLLDVGLVIRLIMAGIEQHIPGEQRGEFLRGKELYKREKEAWKSVLGVDVELKPLPEYITPEVQRNLVNMGFGLRYIPALYLDEEKLKQMSPREYVAELAALYPNWKPFNFYEWNEGQRSDTRISRNLETDSYWKRVKDRKIDFPSLPEQWMAVETIQKPMMGNHYPRTPLAEKLGLEESRVNVNWYGVHWAIDREKRGILAELGISNRPVDFRLLEALEWNLLGNREGWGQTDTYEWTNTKYRRRDDLRRLYIGASYNGGAGCVMDEYAHRADMAVGFRAAVVLRS